jgi:chitin synthase
MATFVLDSAVPTKVLNLCVHKEEREFTHMRYSAATGDPNNFKNNQWLHPPSGAL